MFIFEFIQIIIFISFSFGLSIFLIWLGLNISYKTVDFEKLSAYECGFIPIGDARQPFHVRFYLTGLLFLLFDLEIIYLFIWSITFHWIQKVINAFNTILLFVIFLVLGLIYEWKVGALKWE